MLQRIQQVRSSALNRFEACAEALGLVLTLGGSTAAALFGKLMLAAVLGAVATGIFFRLSGRRAGRARAPSHHAPIWARLVAGLLALATTALLVEATALPVRFDQAGFAYLHWVLVCTSVVLTFHLLVKLLSRLTMELRKKTGSSIE